MAQNGGGIAVSMWIVTWLAGAADAFVMEQMSKASNTLDQSLDWAERWLFILVGWRTPGSRGESIPDSE